MNSAPQTDDEPEPLHTSCNVVLQAAFEIGRAEYLQSSASLEWWLNKGPSDRALRRKITTPPKEEKKPMNNLHLNGGGLDGLKLQAIQLAVADAGGNYTAAAKRLKVQRQMIYSWMKRAHQAVLVVAAALVGVGCAGFETTQGQVQRTNAVTTLPPPPVPSGTQTSFAASSSVQTMSATMAAPAAPNVANVAVAWSASPDPSVTGYRVYYGGASGNYTNSVAVTETSAALALLPATYYFAAVAVNAEGVESHFSNEVAYTVTSSPGVAAALKFYVHIFRADWDGPAGILQVSRDLGTNKVWSDARPIASGSSVLVTNTGPQEFFRVKLN